MIRLYLKIPEKFVRLVPLVCMVKFKLLAQFLVDYLPNPVVSTHKLLLCQFAAFAYDGIDRFISITT